MSSVDIDGIHTLAMRSGQQVVYQGRKKEKAFFTDRQGVPLAIRSYNRQLSRLLPNREKYGCRYICYGASRNRR